MFEVEQGCPPLAHRVSGVDAPVPSHESGERDKMPPPNEVGAGVGSPESGSLRAELIRDLDERLGAEQANQRLPTLVVGLVRDGNLVWWGARGTTGIAGGRPPGTTTQYRVGSISKTFAAVLVMRLRDDGVLDLADAVGEHLPELEGLPITVAQLLSHTSGMRAETAGPWWERTPGVGFAELMSSSIRPEDLLWRPGRRFHYSNVGYAVLGELVSRKRSAPFGEVVRDELLQPLGMDRTTLRPVAPNAEGLAVHPHADLVVTEPEHDAVAMAPAGQLWSTIDDLVRWSDVLSGRRPEILSIESLAEMTEPIGLADTPGQPWTGAYGLGLQLWNQAGKRRYGHSGAMPGFWAMVVVDQRSKDVVLAFANSTYSGLRPAFIEELLGVLASQARPPAPFTTSAGAAGSPGLELVGTWYWGPVEYRMNLGPDRRLELRGQVSQGRDCDFRPNDDSSYVGQWGYFIGERLEVHRRGDGSVSHLDIASFVFTRTPYDEKAYIPGGLNDTWHADQAY